ncbi:unnamed protein product [Clonostachys rosea]|uniref:Prolyl 4-hydroxylase alpha subunit Fe(2+) 2OG dioxygenase domain-containing protein n=1 Tax=Bionectria ochroleuca TaxID=29856 RepID=A0ABY6UK37_BIOOC|nr:unnamed protein product [Clonostachys rosea]
MAAASCTTGGTAPDDAPSPASDLSTHAFRAGIKADLLGALSEIKASGSFASFRPLVRPPDYGLVVDGVGPVNISNDLHESQAKQMIAVAAQAPYRKGSETIVDTAVRNTWELDPSQFRFSDPRWHNYVRALCAQVALDLGISTTIRYEIYKMLIYEQGAMFKPHTDTEKIPGMFGTLVISLPSPHTGGDVIVKHCGEEKVFKTSQAEHSYISWYSDVTHEVLPVTSGYRWVLTYNLAIDTTIVLPSAALLRSNTHSLRHILRRWLLDQSASQKHQALYHVLDHEYTQANIRLSSLKARDLAQVRALQEASNSVPFEIFLALLEKKESGGIEDNYYDYNRRHGRRYYDDDDDEEEDDEGYHHITDVYDQSYTITIMVDFEGRVVMENVSFEAGDLLNEECFDDMEGVEEYEGFMGNSAVVIVPKASVVKFLNCDQPTQLTPANVQSLISYWAQRSECAETPNDDIAMVEKLCDQVWNHYLEPESRRWGSPNAPFEGETMANVLKAALHLQRYDLFERNASRHKGLLPTSFYTGAANFVFAPNNGDTHVAKKFASLEKGLSASILAYGSLATQLLAVYSFTFVAHSVFPAPATSESLMSVNAWACRTFKACLEERLLEPLTSKDGEALCDILLYFKDPLDFFSTSVTPMIRDKSDIPAFYLAFLSTLQKKIVSESKLSEKGPSTYRDVAKLFLSSVEFPALKKQPSESDEGRRYQQIRNGGTAESDQQTIVTSGQILVFFDHILKLGPDGDDLMASFATRFAEQTSRLPAAAFVLWVPVFHGLIRLLIKHDIPLETLRYQEMYSKFFHAFLNNYVKRQPSKDATLSRSGVRCTCADCTHLNAFLSSSTQRVGRFAVNKQRRQHLHNQLDNYRIDCTHETTRVGSPQTLVVTKTNKQNDQARRAWKIRFDGAQKVFGEFDQSQLLQLLGQEYTAITQMRHLVVDPQPEPGAPASSASSGSSSSRQTELQDRIRNTPTSVAGVKRKNPSLE